MDKECLKNNILALRCKYSTLSEKWHNFIRLGKPCPELECNLILANWGIDILENIYCNFEVVNILNPTNSYLEGYFCNIDFPTYYPIEEYVGDGDYWLIDNFGNQVMFRANSIINCNALIIELMVLYQAQTGYYIEGWEGNPSNPYHSVLPDISGVGGSSDIPTYWRLTFPCNAPQLQLEIWAGTPIIGDLIVYMEPNSWIQGSCGGEEYGFVEGCFSLEYAEKLICKINKLLDKNCNCC